MYTILHGSKMTDRLLLMVSKLQHFVTARQIEIVRGVLDDLDEER